MTQLEINISALCFKCLTCQHYNSISKDLKAYAKGLKSYKQYFYVMMIVLEDVNFALLIKTICNGDSAGRSQTCVINGNYMYIC